MWQHLENTKIMLFNETSDDFEFNADRYLFAENPVVHLDTYQRQQMKFPSDRRCNAPVCFVGKRKV